MPLDLDALAALVAAMSPGMLGECYRRNPSNLSDEDIEAIVALVDAAPELLQLAREALAARPAIDAMEADAELARAEVERLRTALGEACDSLDAAIVTVGDGRTEANLARWRALATPVG